MSNTNITDAKRDQYGMTPEDWKLLNAMTDEEITAAALSDPDNPPLSPERLAQFKPTALARRVRHKLGMAHETFAAAYDIPPETLRAWERHESEPTPTELAYLKLIEREPERAKLATAAEQV